MEKYLLLDCSYSNVYCELFTDCLGVYDTEEEASAAQKESALEDENDGMDREYRIKRVNIPMPEPEGYTIEVLRMDGERLVYKSVCKVTTSKDYVVSNVSSLIDTYDGYCCHFTLSVKGKEIYEGMLNNDVLDDLVMVMSATER